jgi:uncharacterized protein (TIGR02271 family)
VEITLSEEQLRVRTETVPVERVRLERYVVSEERTITVTVRREEVRLVREPIDPHAGTVGPQSIPDDEDDYVMVLREEQVEVVTRVVPIERVRLIRNVVVEPRAVSGDVRRERIEVDSPGTPPR